MPDEAERSERGSEAAEMTFWDHTEELAKRLKVVMYAFFISIVVMMILPADFSFLNNPLEYYQPFVAVVLKRIREDVLPSDIRLIGLELIDPIQLYVIASFVFAVALTTPVLVYEIYKFVNPALYQHEKKDLYPFLTSFSALFIIGLVFGYRILMPYMIRAMLPFFSAVGAEMVISIMDFYSLVLVTTLANGLFFTFPVFLVLLVKYGVFGTTVVTKNRKYVYTALLILTFLITPDGGHIGNFMLFAPMILLLEAGVVFARRYEKKSEVRRPRWLRQGPKCKFCGETLKADVVFCSKCGRSQK